MRSVFMALAACVAFSSAASAADFQVPVDEDFGAGSFEWGGGLGTSYQFRWNVIAAGNKLAVCGAGQFLDPTTGSATRDAMRKASVTVNGQNIVRDLNFFTKVKKSANLMQAKATCRDTGVPIPQGKVDVQLDIPTARARF
jgi:hypothetical protein